MIRYMYWVPAQDFKSVAAGVKARGLRLTGSRMTPCETLRAEGNMAIYATPQVFSRMCTRQGSWYRESERNGKFLLLSPQRLGADFDEFLDAEITPSDFKPDMTISPEELIELVRTREYEDQKPEEWEKKTVMDAVGTKVLFTINGLWGKGDSLRKYWLEHRANHANFVSNRFTTEIDGEDVAYSVSENAGVCSSCVEFFNIVTPDRRKLVRSCPGAITFGKAPRDTFLDIRPIRA